MGISNSISRFADYYNRHGLRSTIHRVGLALERVLLANRSVLFYCDLATQSAVLEDLPSSLKVERRTSVGELSPEDLRVMTSFWNPKLARRSIKERFDRGASLWMIRSEDKLAGYGWTLRARTVEKHYFPMGGNDAHLFDFHVFPDYRGRGLNPYLVTKILGNLATEGVVRAYIEAAEWNAPQLSSLGKTPFRQFGCASKVTIFGRTVVWWGGDTRCQSSEAQRAEEVTEVRAPGTRSGAKVTITGYYRN